MLCYGPEEIAGQKKNAKARFNFSMDVWCLQLFCSNKIVFCVKVKTLWFCIIMLKHDFHQLTYMLQLLDPHVMATLERSHGEDYFTVLK